MVEVYAWGGGVGTSGSRRSVGGDGWMGQEEVRGAEPVRGQTDAWLTHRPADNLSYVLRPRRREGHENAPRPVRS